MADNAEGTLFADDKSAVTQAEQAAALAVQTSTATQTQSDMVAALVGEGKKYKNVDDLAKAYISADGFIENLKAENRELREKATASKTIDDVLERLQQQHATSHSDQSGSTGKSPVDVADLTKLVEATVTGLESKKHREGNLRAADAKMKELFGEKAAEKFAQVATTPELKDVYMRLAAADPDKFVSLFANVPKNTTKADTGGSVNTTVQYSSNNSIRAQQPGTKEYYDNVRRTNPALYYSSDFLVGMDRAVRENPDNYYGKK